jgi:GNAT superfamily N-acetyltransferase
VAATVAPFDPAGASDADLEALYRVVIELEREELPDDPPKPLAAFVAELRHPLRYRRGWYYVARPGASDSIIGYAHLYVDDVGDNEHLAYLEGGVLLDERRQGVARALLAPVVAKANEIGRRLLMAYAPEGHEAAETFFRLLGGDRRYIERRSRLRIDDVDRVRMKEWIEQASERAFGYEVVGWTGPCPDELVEPYTQLLHVMNTAPTEALDFDDEVFTPDRLRAEEERLAVLGWEWSTLVARQLATGELAGLTELSFPAAQEWLAYQGNTGVDPLHRNKGLGRWLKAAMIGQTVLERSELRAVDTWNANSNDPMLSINVAMGFKPVGYLGGWQTPVDAAASALEAKR